MQQDSAAQFGAGRAPVYVPAARDPAAGHLLDTPGGHLHDAPALPDEGGWLGPPTPGDVGHGDDVETARQRQGTRRFTETDLRPASARRNGLVVLLIAIAVLGVAAGAALVLTSGRSPAATTGPTQTPTVTLTVSTGVAGAPTAVKVTRDGTSVTVAWTDPTKGTVSFLVVGQGPTGDYLPTRDVAAGTTVVTFIQLDPAKRYCFQVAAVYSITRLAYTAPVCTA